VDEMNIVWPVPSIHFPGSDAPWSDVKKNHEKFSFHNMLQLLYEDNVIMTLHLSQQLKSIIIWQTESRGTKKSSIEEEKKIVSIQILSSTANFNVYSIFRSCWCSNEQANVAGYHHLIYSREKKYIQSRGKTKYFPGKTINRCVHTHSCNF
jgi:hypothetical protein